jgi:hypothetical protein
MKLGTIAARNSFRPFEHLRICTSWRCFIERRLGRNFRWLRSHRQLNRLDSERDHDRNSRCFGNLSEQHPKSIRKYPRPQSIAERLDTDSLGLWLGPQQVKRKPRIFAGLFLRTLLWKCNHSGKVEFFRHLSFG